MAKIDREVTFEEFLGVIRSAYMKTTFADKISFDQAVSNFQKIYNIRKKVAGVVMKSDAELISEIHVCLDPGL